MKARRSRGSSESCDRCRTDAGLPCPSRQAETRRLRDFCWVFFFVKLTHVSGTPSFFPPLLSILFMRDSSTGEASSTSTASGVPASVSICTSFKVKGGAAAHRQIDLDRRGRQNVRHLPQPCSSCSIKWAGSTIRSRLAAAAENKRKKRVWHEGSNASSATPAAIKKATKCKGEI